MLFLTVLLAGGAIINPYIPPTKIGPGPETCYVDFSREVKKVNIACAKLPDCNRKTDCVTKENPHSCVSVYQKECEFQLHRRKCKHLKWDENVPDTNSGARKFLCDKEGLAQLSSVGDQ